MRKRNETPLTQRSVASVALQRGHDDTCGELLDLVVVFFFQAVTPGAPVDVRNVHARVGAGLGEMPRLPGVHV